MQQNSLFGAAQLVDRRGAVTFLRHPSLEIRQALPGRG
jgi:hypothetical protein